MSERRRAYQYINDVFILPALLEIIPCFVFSVGIGHLAGRIHQGLVNKIVMIESGSVFPIYAQLLHTENGAVYAMPSMISVVSIYHAKIVFTASMAINSQLVSRPKRFKPRN